MAQFTAAADLGLYLASKPAFAGRLNFVGHSKGGAQSVVAALRGNFPATTFNAAGVSTGTAAALNIDLALSRTLVTAYSEPGDLLSQFVNKLPFAPGTNGNPVMLVDPGDIQRDISYGAINRHLMEDVIRSINRELKKNDCK